MIAVPNLIAIRDIAQEQTPALLCRLDGRVRNIISKYCTIHIWCHATGLCVPCHAPLWHIHCYTMTIVEPEKNLADLAHEEILD